MADEEEILDLIDQAETRQFARDIDKLERLADIGEPFELVDVGDRIVAQQAILIAAKAGSDPPEASP